MGKQVGKAILANPVKLSLFILLRKFTFDRSLMLKRKEVDSTKTDGLKASSSASRTLQGALDSPQVPAPKRDPELTLEADDSKKRKLRLVLRQLRSIVTSLGGDSTQVDRYYDESLSVTTSNTISEFNYGTRHVLDLRHLDLTKPSVRSHTLRTFREQRPWLVLCTAISRDNVWSDVQVAKFQEFLMNQQKAKG